MATQQQGLVAQYLGVTPPLSLDPPTPLELQAAACLEETMRALGSYESDEMCAARKDVCKTLHALAEAWCTGLAEEKTTAAAAVPAAAAPPIPAPVQKPLLLPFGSYRLDCHDPTSDLDLLLIAPQSTGATRLHFFGGFVESFLRPHASVRELCPVPVAFTPVVKFRMGEIAVDLLFVALPLPPSSSSSSSSSPDDDDEGKIDLLAAECLQGLDDGGVRSLNGVRVAEMVMRLVPSLPAFTTTLRAVKLWAKRRGTAALSHPPTHPPTSYTHPPTHPYKPRHLLQRPGLPGGRKLGHPSGLCLPTVPPRLPKQAPPRLLPDLLPMDLAINPRPPLPHPTLSGPHPPPPRHLEWAGERTAHALDHPGVSSDEQCV